MFFYLQIIVALLIILIVKWIVQRRRQLQLLQNLGYKVPPVHLVGGNLIELFTSPDGDLATQERWMTEIAEDFGQGKILGWYRGPRPVIYATDPAFLKEVFIKESETFIDRPMLDRSDNIPHLIMLKGARWKSVRSTLTPTFSAAKMKKMATIMTESIKIMINVVEKHAANNTEANFYELFQALTLDVIGQCGLGMKVNCQVDNTDELLVMVKRSMKRQIDLTAVIGSFFPSLEDVIAWMYRGGRKETNDTIISWCADILKERRKMNHASGEKPVDSLQLMIEAAGGLNGQHRKLTDEEITGNAFVFILAGYETTATSLSFTSYLIAAHPQVQDQICEEIDKVEVEKLNPEDLAEAIGKLPYLDAVFKEALRMYPPIPLHFGRFADSEKTVMGKKIPQGSAVMIPTWTIHHDANLWPDPWKFDPTRFAPENKNTIKEMSYMAFGEGPRKCIGQRFALLEAKLALFFLLRSFKLSLAPKTSHPIKYRNKGISLAPENDAVWIIPEARN